LNMVYFNAMFIPVTLVWSMLLASMLHRRPRGAGAIRAALFVSLFVSLTAGGIAWRSMYHPTHGMINGVLTALGLGPVDFLNQPRLALPAIVLMNVWRWFPLCVVILMAGMRRIPSEMFDLATTDGASHWQMIRHVSVPLLRRSWAICVILLVVISLRSFEEIYVMTLDGGPSTWSTTLPFLLYRTSMQCFDLGTTTTIAAILALIIGLCVFILYGIGWRQFGDRRIQ